MRGLAREGTTNSRRLLVRAATVKVSFPTLRWATVSTTGGAIPLPLSDTVAGLPEALWAMTRKADFGPGEAGAKVTVIV